MGIVPVPSSLAPGGVYSLRREFLLPRLGGQERAILHFNAINYHGRVSLNGTQLGATIPYVPQEFDGTQQAREGRNTVEVQIVDAGTGPNGLGKDEVVFGTPGGWESYGGIIRDAYAEIRPASYVDNVRFGYRLGEGYRKASCTAQVFVAANETGERECELVLLWGGSEVASARTRVRLSTGARPRRN